VKDLDLEEGLTVSFVELADASNEVNVGGGSIEVMDLHRREISDEQLRRFEQYAAEMFSAFGMELNSPATVDTPRRFVRALLDATAGYEGDPKLLTVFET
jgi:GTP cyclohydrolase I